MVHVGRITALSALIIAAIAVEPLLGGLDQAFQYIQEYSGFIYPGICIVFGLGLLWKRASGKAAVWTSIATIPVGVIFKIAFPDMPFQFRMGYVFIVLFLIFVAVTYGDKTAINTDLPIAEDRRKMMKWSKITGIAALICFLAAAIQKTLYLCGSTNEIIIYLDNIGFEAFFCTTALLSTVSLLLYSNSKDAVKDPKAVDVDLTLFKTDKGFALGALGICLILAFLYIVFW